MVSAQEKEWIMWLYVGRGLSVRMIAKVLKLSRWTVAHAINSEYSPRLNNAMRREVKS